MILDPFADICRCRPASGHLCHSCLRARRAKAAQRNQVPGDGHPFRDTHYQCAVPGPTTRKDMH
jgi:hypothetical protein